MNKNYEEKKQYKNMMKVLIYASLNLAIFGLFRINIFKYYLDLFGLGCLEYLFYLILFCSAILLNRRDVFLPFLGDTVIPHSILPDNLTPENADVQKIINITPNTKILYWAAESNDMTLDNPWEAYGNYTNIGTTISDETGDAILSVRYPASYKKPYKSSVLQPHIHYRYVLNPGMMSRIETVQI